MSTLNGKVALVTGAGRGLGRAYALALATQGATVVAADIDSRSFQEYGPEAARSENRTTAEEIELHGSVGYDRVADASSDADMTGLTAWIESELGRLDIVVCNAGGGSGDLESSTPSRVSAEQFEAVLRRNLIATATTCRATIPLLIASHGSRIITVASQAGLAADPSGGYSDYGAAKAGIIMYTRYLAREMGPHGITANCIAPGRIETGRLSLMFDKYGREGMTKQIPMGRLGTPEDCSGLIAFLASDAASYISGATIPVDGAAMA